MGRTERGDGGGHATGLFKIQTNSKLNEVLEVKDKLEHIVNDYLQSYL